MPSATCGVSIATFVFFCCAGSCAASPGRNFRGLAAGAQEASGRLVTAVEIEASLKSSLEAVLGGGDTAVAQRLASIEASMWKAFQALPKNELGRLAPRAVRYIVHNYFAKEHGWIINGLEPDAMQVNVTELHEVSILEDKAPAFVEGLLEARRSGHGLSLGDVVVMAGALERLIFHESIALLQTAYAFNGQHVDDKVDEGTLHEILTSYLLVFEMGAQGNTSDTIKHQKIKAKMVKGSPTWSTMVEFEQDAVTNFNYRSQSQTNPFGTGRQYSFRAASAIVEELAQGYGKWQNTECRQMREHLMSLDPEGSGRVSFDAFYSQADSAEYQFTESVEYLRKIGALDEAVGGSGPKVRIANYVAGPSNCIASSTYYSVCCLSDCESLRNELEGTIKAPMASAETLLGLVSNMSSSSVQAPRELPIALQEKLQTIAERHGGEVPLHGRLFTQWMHYAFPNECPYPHLAEEGEAIFTPSQWAERKAMASPEEKQQLVLMALGKVEVERTSEPVLSQWTDDEVLPLHELPRRGAGAQSLLGGIVRALMQTAVVCAVLKLASSAWAQTPAGAAGKDKRAQLPLHF